MYIIPKIIRTWFAELVTGFFFAAVFVAWWVITP